MFHNEAHSNDTKLKISFQTVVIRGIMFHKHIFLSISMMVSARDGDGTVKEAIQHLIRHLLETKYALKRHRPKTKKGKTKEKKAKEFDKLETIGINEVGLFEF